MNRFIIAICSLAFVVLLSSCETTQRFGSKHKRFSSDRIALFDTKRHKKPRRSSRTYAYKSKKRTPSANKAEADSRNHNTVVVNKKARYHSERNNILREAKKYNGIPYVYGGKKPDQGFDCSGFVSYVFTNNQIYIGGNATSLSKLGSPKEPEDLNKGDLVFFGQHGQVSHVGIVTMNDGKNLTMIHSASSSGIRSDNVTHSDYWRPRLMFGVDVITSHFEEDLGMK